MDTKIDEALELLGAMRQAQARCDFERVRRGYVRRRRRTAAWNAVRTGAAVLIPAAVLAGFILLRPHMDVTAPQQSAVLVLPDGERVKIDRSDNWSRVASVAGADVYTGGGNIRYEADKTESVIPQQRETGYSSLIVPVGAQFDITLEDGTRVWLNAGSSLRFPSVFGDSERRVALSGEGYFEVSRDTLRRFVVETGTQQLTVLGTRFNLTAYEGENALTTLLDGKVALLSPTGSVELSPGEQAEMDVRSGIYSVRTVLAADDYARWRDGVFVVENDTLEEVMEKLARWYGVEVQFLFEGARDMVYHGTIPRYEHISQVLQRIEEVSTVSFAIEGKRVKVM